MTYDTKADTMNSHLPLDSDDIKITFKSSNAPDTTIQFGHYEIKAHRAILTKHSRWFEIALRGPYLESLPESVIQLHDDAPEAVLAMLKCFYSSPVDNNNQMTSSVSAIEVLERLKCLIALIVVADKYDASTVRASVIEQFKTVFSKHIIRLFQNDHLEEVICLIYDSEIAPPNHLRENMEKELDRRYCNLKVEDASKLQEMMKMHPQLTLHLLESKMEIERLRNVGIILQVTYYVRKCNMSPSENMRKLAKPFCEKDINWHALIGDCANLTTCLEQIHESIDQWSTNETEDSALHMAVCGGRMPSLRILVTLSLRMGLAIDGKGARSGLTPLEWVNLIHQETNMNGETCPHQHELDEMKAYLKQNANAGSIGDSCCGGVLCSVTIGLDKKDNRNVKQNTLQDYECAGEKCCDACRTSFWVLQLMSKTHEEKEEAS